MKETFYVIEDLVNYFVDNKIKIRCDYQNGTGTLNFVNRDGNEVKVSSTDIELLLLKTINEILRLRLAEQEDCLLEYNDK